MTPSRGFTYYLVQQWLMTVCVRCVGLPYDGVFGRLITSGGDRNSLSGHSLDVAWEDYDSMARVCADQERLVGANCGSRLGSGFVVFAHDDHTSGGR